MTQVLSTSSFYNHNWTNAEFDKRRSIWFEKIRQSENKKRASVFPSLVYSRHTTHLKSHLNETNHCMNAIRTTTNKSSKEELIQKSPTLSNTHSTTSVEETSRNIITPPHHFESRGIIHIKKSPSPIHLSRKSHEKVSKNNVLQSPSASTKLENVTDNLSVPSWTIDVYTGRYVIEGTEDLSDNVFLDRHERLELVEKKRRRRDERCHEERERLNRLKQQGTSIDNPCHTVRYIEMVDKEPKCAFGRVIPDLKPQCFSLPSHFFTMARHGTSNIQLVRNCRTNISKSKKK